MKLTLTCTGADDAARRLRTTGLRAFDQSRAMSAAARDTAHDIDDVPVDTGRLQRSVRSGAHATRQGFEIRSDIPYARFVFGGTRYVPARPPTIPSDVGARTAQLITHDLQRPT